MQNLVAKNEIDTVIVLMPDFWGRGRCKMIEAEEFLKGEDDLEMENIIQSFAMDGIILICINYYNII